MNKDFNSTDATNIHKDKIAFTLAEVLITLAIVGVVSAITMPVLHSKFETSILENKLKAVYTDISNAVLLYMSDNEYSHISQTPFSTYSNDSKDYFYENILNKYIGCEKNNKTLKYAYLYTNNRTLNFKWQFECKKGYYIAIAEPMWGSYLTIYFDTNGTRGPNKIGKDMFRFYYYDKPTPQDAYQKNFKDWDCSNCADSCNLDLNPTANGYGCWERIMQNGWKIDY